MTLFPSSGRGLSTRLSGLPYVALSLAAALTPRARRDAWLREWRAELWQLGPYSASKRDRNRTKRNHFNSLSLTRGILVDAAWLRLDQLASDARASSRRSSPRWCLQMLTICCVLSALAEWVLAGSWRAISPAMGQHLMGCFVFVVVPAVLVGVATAPLRPRKCDRKSSRLEKLGLAGLLSANLRWNLFLAAKVAFVLIWSFLVSDVITLAAHRVIGHFADWVELLATALAVILSIRWALLNQERRCQHCLRMLSQPTRVGFASRNFLDWNGMELYCADGHGLLHVTEMEGSWCWYDLWVELDPTWHGLFSA